MMKRVSEARKLAALHPVPGVVLGRDALVARVKEHVDREVPPEAIRHEGLVLQILGFVPTSFDYEAETFKLLDAQLAGFYEPADGTMYMAADLQGESAEATLAHELDHALQDQHFDLKPHAKYEAGKSDAESAFDALAEGDATSTMADVLLSHAAPGRTALDLPEHVFVEQVLESVSSGPTADAPHIMRTSLVAPYVYGTLFVNALRRRGGWSAVDAAWTALPDDDRADPPRREVARARAGARRRGADVRRARLGMERRGRGHERGARDAHRVRGVDGRGSGEGRSGRVGGDRTALLAERRSQSALAIHVRYDAKRAARRAEDPFALVAEGSRRRSASPRRRMRRGCASSGRSSGRSG